MRPLPLALIAVVAVGAFALAGAARAQGTPPAKPATPAGWNYEIKNGQRVPKADRTVNADGSWREEVRQGDCSAVKEKGADGTVKVTRKCD